jgi:hypothetical protein
MKQRSGYDSTQDHRENLLSHSLLLPGVSDRASPDLLIRIPQVRLT